MSSKLQEIQSTQVLFRCHPRYTSTSVHKDTLFLYFSDFSLFLLKAKKKKNKNKKKEGTNILKRKTRDRKQMAMHERGRERSCQENNTNVLV